MVELTIFSTVTRKKKGRGEGDSKGEAELSCEDTLIVR